MSAIAGPLRAARRLFMGLRFRIWVVALRLALSRHGMKLVVDAPHGAMLDDLPQIRIYEAESSGTPGATMTLRFGRDVHLGRRLTLEVKAGGDSSLELADGVAIFNNVRILLRAGGVALGARTQVRDSAWFKSDGLFSTGAETTIGPFAAIHCSERIEFADRVGLGERVSVLDSEHEFDESDAFYMDLPISIAPVTIGAQTMIGPNSVVLKGVTIGANCVVGAGALVRSDSFADGSLIVGNPAKRIRGLGPGSEA